MSINRAILIFVMVMLIGGAVVPVLVLAQYRVNNQIYGTQGSVRFAGSIQIPSATYQTPSAVRMAIHASGATPSQLKTEYNRVGPLAPSGAIAYVPATTNVYAKTTPTMPQGNLVNTQLSRNVAPSGYSTNYAPSAPAASPAMNNFSTGASTGSIRYAPSAPPSYSGSVTSWSSLSNSPSITGQPSSFSSPLMASPSTGSVRYSQ
jgi:hypothetical protein